jgi:cell division protein FtsB
MPSDPTVSDGATFEEMVEKVAIDLHLRTCTTVDEYDRCHLLDAVEISLWTGCGGRKAHRDYFRNMARYAFAAAGVPDLLAAHQADRALIEAKDAEIEELRRENNRAVDRFYDMKTEAATAERYRKALERINTPGSILMAHQLRAIARAALEGSEPAVEAGTEDESPKWINDYVDRMADPNFKCGHAWIEAVKAKGADPDTPNRVRVCSACREREAWIDGEWRPYPFPVDSPAPAVEAEQRCAHGKTVSQTCRLCLYDELLPDPAPAVEADEGGDDAR